MALITKKVVALAGTEASYGTTASLSARNNAFEIISDLSIQPMSEVLTRSPYSNSLSAAKALQGKKWHEISFVTELRGSGDAAVAPTALSALLQSCGTSETVAADVTWEPLSSSFVSSTLQFFVDGQCHTVHGAIGNAKFMFITGETAKIEFNLMGKYIAPTACAMISTNYEETTPPIVIGCTLTFDNTTTFEVQQLEIDLGNVIAERPSLSDPTGIAGFQIVNRESVGSMNPEAVLPATYNFWDVWESSTAKDLSITLGETAGNKFTITCPKTTIDSISYGDRNGVRIFELPLRFGRDSGDDEISIVQS